MTWRSRAANLLREPLVHFLLAGAVVYALLAGRAPDLGERRIVVNEALVTQLAARWNENYRRPPSPAELDGLIADYVRDQAYYREALRLGLDKDDDVVVRRMRNKLIALSTSEAEAATPSDAQLQALLDKDKARYAPETRFSFAQVYLGPDTDRVRAAAKAALPELNRGGDPVHFAQPVPIPAAFTATPASEVAGLLGDDFVTALRRLPQGQWSGPVVSAIGLHLVRVTARSADAKPRLADVRQALENDWRADARRRAEDAAYRRILDGYDVKIEMPK
ncbi:peptidyl-prolyl cis-trans isomerase [Novosphingobium aquiterrae]|uniref:Peptidyl-prolyl cis-trans isomerase n=1 Tax=Novosphingobium aquiterrae TaxID=624388 RepID=A0ABV6PHI7_9SPHN